VCDLETSRMGAPYIYDISRLRVNVNFNTPFKAILLCISWWQKFDSIKTHGTNVGKIKIALVNMHNKNILKSLEIYPNNYSSKIVIFIYTFLKYCVILQVSENCVSDARVNDVQWLSKLSNDSVRTNSAATRTQQ